MANCYANENFPLPVVEVFDGLLLGGINLALLQNQA